MDSAPARTDRPRDYRAKNISSIAPLGLLANGTFCSKAFPPGENAHRKNDGGLYSNRLPAFAIHADLLPADLIGTLIYNPRTGEFTTKLGPLFSNLILADEINRAPAKVQERAPWKPMQERQVTIAKPLIRCPSVLVLATQNPLEQEGTYHFRSAARSFHVKLHMAIRKRPRSARSSI